MGWRGKERRGRPLGCCKEEEEEEAEEGEEEEGVVRLEGRLSSAVMVKKTSSSL